MMKKAFTSTFLSTLLFPGIGQIYNKQPIKGIVLILLGILCLAVLFQAIIKSLLNTLPDPEKISLTPGLISSLTEKVLKENQDLFLITIVIFGVIWIFGIIDAYRFGKKIDQSIK